MLLRNRRIVYIHDVLKRGARMSGTGLQKLAFFLLLALIVYVSVAGGA